MLHESHRPGIEPAPYKSQVQRPTAKPPCNTQQVCLWTTSWPQFKSDCHQTWSVIPLAKGYKVIKFWKVKVSGGGMRSTEPFSFIIESYTRYKKELSFLSFLNVDWPQLSSVVLAVSHMTPVWSAAANGKTSLKWLTSKCQSGSGAERWTGQGCRWTSDSPGLVRQYGTPRGDAFRNTWQAAQAYFPPSPYIALTPHTPIQKVSALGSRVGWTPARKEWTNERPTSMSSVTKKLNFISSVLKGIVCFSPCIVVCDRIATLYVTYACIID